jgi:hypothetical protein
VRYRKGAHSFISNVNAMGMIKYRTVEDKRRQFKMELQRVNCESKFTVAMARG